MHNEKLLTEQELTDVLNEHINKHENIKQRNLFLSSALTVINGALVNYTDYYEDIEKVKFQSDILNKITEYVENFYSKYGDSAASFTIKDKLIQYDKQIFKSEIINYAKKQKDRLKLTRDEFETIKNDISYNKISNALSQKYYDAYLFNEFISIGHELLHTCKLQAFDFGNSKSTSTGFNILSLTHKPLKNVHSPYYALDEAVNSLHEISLIVDAQQYKGSCYYSNKDSISCAEKPFKYDINHSFLHLLMSDKDNKITDRLPYLAGNYFNAINIAEMLEQLVGKTKLFSYAKDEAYGLYVELKKHYQNSITKYLNKINIILKDELNDLKNSIITEPFINLENFDNPSILFVISMITSKLINGENKYFFDCQELAQSLLLNCLSMKVENIYLNEYVDELKDAKKEITNLQKNVSGCVFRPQTENSSKYDCEKEFDNFNNVCVKKLAEIDYFISKYSNEEQGR
ncbi:MAG: hypothetical protein PHO33_01335 [Clostridia bacterium]|nr:hypothetical protein [Clostridia bacterium]